MFRFPTHDNGRHPAGITSRGLLLHVTLSATFLIVVVMTGVEYAGAVDTGQKDQHAVAGQKVYLLTRPDNEDAWKLTPPGLHWKEAHRIWDERAAQLIRVVPRSQIDPSVYIDFEGLRLYADGARCRRVWRARITASYHIRTLLQWMYEKTGIEPDRIPVRGELSKKLGTNNMVLIQGGEFIRPGHYYTSPRAHRPARWAFFVGGNGARGKEEGECWRGGLSAYSDALAASEWSMASATASAGWGMSFDPE